MTTELYTPMVIGMQHPVECLLFWYQLPVNQVFFRQLTVYTSSSCICLDENEVNGQCQLQLPAQVELIYAAYLVTVFAYSVRIKSVLPQVAQLSIYFIKKSVD